ncbi:MAG TPA: hypothetical protein VGZ04_04730, partial [Acidimicrobiales bacterium]|nr:hypothetical protein [Acidimicrobiales bacterium]
MRRLLFSLALIAAVPIAITATPPSALASSSNQSANVIYTSSTMNLQKVGTVNLGAATAPAGTAAPVSTASTLAGLPSAVRFGAPPVDLSTGGFAPAASAINTAGAVSTGSVLSVQRDKQVQGFEGISGPQQASVNGGGDLEPPDQGTCAGPSDSNGPVTVEIINNALSVYTPSGTQLLPVTSTTTLFDQPSTAFLSDPRCYYDVQTQRWFFTELSISSATTSVQFVAVSQTDNPMGSYTVFAIDTTDATNPYGDCPCFGDYDQIGADANGFYIATNEFSINNSPPAAVYNGSVIYAISKQRLASAADGGKLPSVA